MNYLESSSRIIRRCQDKELSTGVGPGGPVDSIVRPLSTPELRKLIKKVDYEARGEPDANIRYRYKAMDLFLHEILDRRGRDAKRRNVIMQADRARTEKSETCDCGSVHPIGANFYVTVTEDGKYIPLAGPYPTHAEALGLVDNMKELAIQTDPRAAFAAFGTTAMSENYKKPGIFNHLIKR
jgi:hypothetical protein